jgi:bifunctional DNA-binding transcriptional regulator/antitoxin component of YhaV-PrlF toxin-antitoxin module
MRVTVSIVVMRMVEVAVMGTKGTIVVPQKLREELGLKQGDAIAMDATSGKLVAQKLKTPSREELLMRWNETTKEWNKKATALGIKEEDVVGIIHKRRKMKD